MVAGYPVVPVTSTANARLAPYTSDVVFPLKSTVTIWGMGKTRSQTSEYTPTLC